MNGSALDPWLAGSPSPVQHYPRRGGGAKQVKLTWVRAHKDDERSRKLRAASWSDITPCTIHLAPDLKITRGRGSARDRRLLSYLHLQQQRAGLSPRPVDGTPSGSDLQCFSSA
ncbi:hypothetical protein NDU88_006962 [Pleurodeles waltl]|uniref:Uncharacterized protein n=1 Tax=Pleurodeles waltl TaxID=8319 RepID=A0AAV7RQG6_PLEWA|nr:hypothetical protein NDU88_006962 [Pleurodeles waltl]